ncbi:uncharacterized protein LOC142581869 [Dermacentor variabilis]|uniref:uncharacterized protein LOC142581869 n=1 Tax=Dermacentor variabilis TaxID=34621 RepID=UPI003F5C8ECB
MPMFLAFYIGRHPSQATANAIYMTLEPRIREWISDIDALAERSKEDDYLRRCAEIVGREGQSYSIMIQEVLQTHSEVVDLVRSFWGSHALPRFYNLSDPDLRRAINGHLPDDSQLWPEDEIVVLQPDLISKLDAEHWSPSGFQESFKLFLGAYVVWALSPLVSRHVSTRVLLDVGGRDGEANQRLSKCIQTLEMVMPLVMWQLHRDAQRNLWPTWTIARLSARSVASFFHSYSDVPQAFVSAILSKIGANSFNMTNTWETLDNAMAYLSDDTDAPFFDLYRTAARATVTFFKQSLRQPKHNIHHIPGLASAQVYRLIVTREVSIPHFLTSSPLYQPWYPAAVISALAGTLASAQIAALLRIAIYYDSRFQRYQSGDVSPKGEWFVRDLMKFKSTFNASGIFPDATKQEIGTVYSASIAAHVASGLLDMPEWRRSSSGAGRVSSSDGDAPNPFRSFQPEQLFFYLTCFAQCGKPGRQRQENIAICNFALPASPRFRRAFKCLPRHRLVTNFTWPEIRAAPAAMAS